MKNALSLIVVGVCSICFLKAQDNVQLGWFYSNSEAHSNGIKNDLIDYTGFQSIVVNSAQIREKGRLTEKEFIQAMESGDYVLLDARSAAKYKLRHIKSAINLPFTEFTEADLKRFIPDKGSKVLIYCNNNFLGSFDSFPPKFAAASLNLSTQASLRAYGYTNIFELGPVLHVEKTEIAFEGEELAQSEQGAGPNWLRVEQFSRQFDSELFWK
jgi:hypothetical protein